MLNTDTPITVIKDVDGTFRITAGVHRARAIAASHGGTIPRSAIRAANFSIDELPGPVPLTKLHIASTRS